MSDDPKQHPDRPNPVDPDAETAEVPLARSAAPSGPGDVGKPIFEIAEDRCPRCNSVMGPSDVVCTKCGYDLRANVVREVETGEVHEPDPPPGTSSDDRDDFVEPGGLKPKTLGIIGGVLTVLAMVASGVFAPSGATTGAIVGLIVLCVYNVAVHTATGTGAVAVAAILAKERFGRLDYAVARMFAAFALFQLLTRVHLPLGYIIFSVGLPWLLALAAYWGSIMLLFKKDRGAATVVAIAHFCLWILLNLGMELSAWVGSSIAASAPPPA